VGKLGFDRVALARAVTAISAGTDEGRAVLAKCPSADARIIGWTGPPGAGKSSLIASVVQARRAASPDRALAILAVDPSSSFTGGAVLGDRIRMDSLTLDGGVFIRSLASRGSGEADLAPVLRVARYLACSGFAEVHIETVGAGQNDVAIAGIASTVAVVLSPHAGDAIQGLKAGLLETADLFIVNKSDIAGADVAAASLEIAVTPRRGGWDPPVILVSARTGEGIERLSAALDDHAAAMDRAGETEKTSAARRAHEFEETVRAEMWRATRHSPRYASLAARVASGELDPWEAARDLCRDVF
jgi:LAO/AO transport system kinase